MAEEGNLGFARALDGTDDTAKEDLQHRMEKARESVTNSDIGAKDAVDQYQSERKRVIDVLDWREQVRTHPVAWSLGALGLGIVVGYGLLELIDGDDGVDADESEQFYSADIQNNDGGPSAFTNDHSYAAHALAVARVDSERAESGVDRPKLIDRLKETRAYDRLQEEVADLGNRFMDELSNAARTVVLPAFFNKLKQMIGVDLSNKRQSSASSTQVTPDDSTRQAPEGASPRDGAALVSEQAVSRRSEFGKPAYAAAKEKSGKIDRAAGDSSAPDVRSSPAFNLDYDDRYERESRLFSKGEIRNFAPEKSGEDRPSTMDTPGSAEEDTPRGGEYTYEPGHRAD